MLCAMPGISQKLTHAQTMNTRLFFPSSKETGYKARAKVDLCYQELKKGEEDMHCMYTYDMTKFKPASITCICQIKTPHIASAKQIIIENKVAMQALYTGHARTVTIMVIMKTTISSVFEFCRVRIPLFPVYKPLLLLRV